MPVGLTILPARHVNPVVLLVGSLENQLIEVSVVLQPVEPLAGGLQVTRQGGGLKKHLLV